MDRKRKESIVNASRQKPFEPVAITGISCLFPKATGVGAYWANIKNGVDCITEVPDSRWKLSDYYSADPNTPDHTYTRTGGFLDPVPFHPLEYGISPNALEATDTSQLLTLLATRRAMTDAGYFNGKTLDRDRVSVILGVTGAQELVIPLGARLYHPLFRDTLIEAGLTPSDAGEIVRRINHKMVGWQEGSFPGLLGNVVAGRIANRFDFGGTNCVVDAACAGSLSAIHMACMELQSHRADMVVSGGVDTFNDIFMYMCFSKTKAISAGGHARPFDRGGDGTIVGEGLGVILLKRLDDAVRDGDTVYAVIRGLGASSDGKGNAIYAPSAEGQKKALNRAYAASGITPETVELLEAHGTGTPVGDAIELEALTEIYRNARSDGRWCALGSVKSQIGHTKSAAGIAGLIKAALALHYRVLPPTIKVDDPLEPLARGTGPFYLNTGKRPWVGRTDHPRRAAVSAFGFGGSNYHAVLEEYANETAAPDWDGDVQILAFSEASPKALKQRLREWKAPADWNGIRAEAQALRNTFDNTRPHRLVAVLRRGDAAEAVIDRALEHLDSESETSWEIPTGIFYGCGDVPGKLAVVFSGQGTQYPGMLRDMACQFPEFMAVLDAANSGFETHSLGTPDARLTDVIYPVPGFTDADRDRQVETLQQTAYAQPGIGAVSIGAWRVLSERFGLSPDAAAGHSYGEICGLCAAGVLSAEDFHHLSSLRGKLMSAGDQDRGGMAAVTVPIADIQKVLDAEKLQLVIANKNSPSQGVISGASDEIKRALEAFGSRDMRIIPLKVSAAFHSPLIADATRPFGEHLEDVKLNKAAFPVYSNTTAQAYPKQQKQVRDILAAQLENPVEFVDEIKRMHADGIRTFLEVGPGRRMTGLVGQILEGEDFHALALDASAGKKSGEDDLARALGRLASLGYAVRLEAWDDVFEPARAQDNGNTGMTVMLTGANYVRDREPLPPFTVSGTAAVKDAAASVAGKHPEQGSGTTGPSPGEAFTAIQENLTGLQRLQEQTALLHQQFLAAQQESQQAFQRLIGQQQSVLTGQPQSVPTASPGAPVRPTVASTSVPAPAAQPASPQATVTPPPGPGAPLETTAEFPVPAGFPAESLTVILMDVVSEKTGYPKDLLEPDMELDGDLGIDSIKRVEILSALQDKIPNLPTIGPDRMGTIRTLADIVSLLQSLGAEVGSGAPETPAAAPAAPVPSPATPAPADRTTAPGKPPATPMAERDIIVTVISEKTGYPTDLLEPDMELDADLGIDSIKRVEILSALQDKIPGLPPVTPDKMASIRTLQDIVELLAMLQAQVEVAAVSAPPSGEKKRKKGIFDTKPIDMRTATGSIREKYIILNIIAEHAGKALELLEPEMVLETDLGVDADKKTAILSALREKFTDLPESTPDEVAGVKTVKDIMAIVGRAHASQPARPKSGPIHVKRPPRSTVETKVEPAAPDRPPAPAAPEPGAAPVEAPARPAAAAAQSGTDTGTAAAKPAAVVSMKEIAAKLAGSSGLMKVDRKVLRTVPLETDRRTVAYPEHAEIWITRDDSGLSELIFEEFENQFIPCRLVSLDYLEFVEIPDQIAGVIIVGPRDTCNMDTLNNMFRLMKLASKSMRRKEVVEGQNPLIVSIIRLDGEFGLSGRGIDFQPMTAAIAGMTKSIQHEWPETRCKIIDIEADRSYQPDIADLMRELFLDGPLEMGISSRGKVRLELVDMPLDTERMTGEPLLPGDWVLATGGGRGVTAVCACEIARRFGVNLILAGRSDPPVDEPDWLQPLHGEAEIKQAILDHQTRKVSPKELNTIYRKWMKNRELLQTLETVRALGVQVRYEPVDVTRTDAVDKLIHRLKQEKITVSGLLHGAGVIADKLLEEKDPEDFDIVVRTKVESLRCLSEYLDLDRLKILVLFSSSTARFGRRGQVDYAMANEVLNKFAHKFAAIYPECRTVSVNWGPWDGGMVTPELRKLFESEGINVIDPASGARYLSRELRLEYGKTVGKPAEIVVIGTTEPDQEYPGDLEPVWEDAGDAQAAGEERDAGAQREAVSDTSASDDAKEYAAYTGEEGDTGDEIEMGDGEGEDIDDNEDFDEEAPVSLAEAYRIPISEALFPILKSHLINGMPVVPMALLMELSARGAVMQHAHLKLFSLENFRLLKGIILKPETEFELECKIGDPVREDRSFRIPVELRGVMPDGKKFVHVSTDAILVPRLPDAPEAPDPLENPEPYPIHQAQLYSDVLFHGEMLQSIRSVEGVNEAGITAAVDGVPAPDVWMTRPLSSDWLTDPMSIDAAFQLMILWTELMLEAPSLPTGFKAYRQYRQDLPAWSYADIRVTDHHGNQVFADIWFKDDEGRVIASIESYECITDQGLREAFRVRKNNG